MVNDFQQTSFATKPHPKTTGLDTVGMRTKSGRTKFEICQWVYPQDNLRVDAQQNVL
jgi:hypothetical protein